MRQDKSTSGGRPQLRWWLVVCGLMVCRAGAAAPSADLPLPIVDSHMHMRTATADVEELFAKIQSLTQAGPVGSITIACLPPWDDQALDHNALALLFKARHPRTTYTLGGLSYNFPGRPNEQLDYAQQAQRLLALGFDGIKMIEGKPSMRKVTHLPSKPGWSMSATAWKLCPEGRRSPESRARCGPGIICGLLLRPRY